MALGYQELVDTFCDIVELAEKLGAALEDGVQIEDAFVILAEAAKITELIKDAPAAFSELKDLTAQESLEVEKAISQRLGSTTNVRTKINTAVGLLTRCYLVIQDFINFKNSFKG